MVCGLALDLDNKTRPRRRSGSTCWASSWQRDHAVRRAQRAGRDGASAAACSATAARSSCVSSTPSRRRSRPASWSTRPRQPRHPQAPQGPRLAEAAPPLDLPLHPDLVLLAERGRGLLRQADQAPPRARQLPLPGRPPGCHRRAHLAEAQSSTRDLSSGRPSPTTSSRRCHSGHQGSGRSDHSHVPISIVGGMSVRLRSVRKQDVRPMIAHGRGRQLRRRSSKLVWGFACQALVIAAPP